MARRIKVLAVNKVSDEYGGVPIFLMNVHKNIDHDKYHLDFLTPDITSYNPWRDEIECVGENIFEFHINCNTTKGIRMFGQRLRSFLMEHHYDIVHINCGSVFFDYVTAVVAKASGAKTVVHSHNSGERSWLKKVPIFFLKCRMQKHADVLCACSFDAARCLFTYSKVNNEKVIIVNNGIDLQKFTYNQIIREKLRYELQIEDRFVVGHVGRFAEQKNHEFLIDIFAEILRTEPTAVLLLIGEGELEDHIREKVHNLNMDSNVTFLGKREDVADLYQAMDVFLFPSLYEGLPISLVEAQASGLPCCISDTISKEVDITTLISRVSLRDSADAWARKVFLSAVEPGQRCSKIQAMQEAGYGIYTTALKITGIYESLM